MREEDVVENFCFEMDLVNEGWLDSGDFGNAYDIGDDKVLKITSDKNEFIQAFNLLGKDLTNHPKIYQMRVLNSGEMLILMEKLDTCGAEDVFSEVICELEEKGVCFESFCINELNLSEKAKKMLEDIDSAIYELRTFGVSGFDIHYGNIGMKENGDYAIFDQTIKNSVCNEDLFQDVSEKLRVQYEIDEDSPIVKESVCISKILVDHNAMSHTLVNILQGKISKSSGNIECMYNSDGFLQLTDGHHRFCENLLKGDETVSINIVFDERAGELSSSFAKIEKKDSLETNPDEVYGGLEEIMSPDKLEEILDNLIAKKTRHKKRRMKP